jgi:hypothetical protein
VLVNALHAVVRSIEGDGFDRHDFTVLAPQSDFPPIAVVGRKHVDFSIMRGASLEAKVNAAFRPSSFFAAAKKCAASRRELFGS